MGLSCAGCGRHSRDIIKTKTNFFFSQLSQCPQPLQVLRQRQLSQGLLPPQGGVYGNNQPANNITPSSSTNNWPSNPTLHIKQEIQIPQVSSLTSSPDSSPSPGMMSSNNISIQSGHLPSPQQTVTQIQLQQQQQQQQQQQDPTKSVQWQITTSSAAAQQHNNINNKVRHPVTPSASSSLLLRVRVMDQPPCKHRQREKNIFLRSTIFRNKPSLCFLFQDNFNFINQPSSASRGLLSPASSGPVQGKMPPAIRYEDTVIT